MGTCLRSTVSKLYPLDLLIHDEMYQPIQNHAQPLELDSDLSLAFTSFSLPVTQDRSFLMLLLFTVTPMPAPLGWGTSGEILIHSCIILQLSKHSVTSHSASKLQQLQRKTSLSPSTCTTKSLQRAVLVLLKDVRVPLIL